MKLRFPWFVFLKRGGVVLLALLPSGVAARAQYSELDSACAKLAKGLKHEHILMIAVADFAPADGVPKTLGHVYAGFVSLSLQNHDAKLPILDHDSFEKEAARSGVIPERVSTEILAHHSTVKIPEDVLVVGSVEKGPQQYQIELAAIRLRDYRKLVSETVSFAATDFLENLNAPFPPPMDEPPPRAGINGVSSPSCIYCPEPDYNDFARRLKISGRSVLDVVIGANGRALAVRPIRWLGAGLDEEAVNAILNWRFKPAINAQGQPVNVLVPVEVTFRLF